MHIWPPDEDFFGTIKEVLTRTRLQPLFVETSEERQALLSEGQDLDAEAVDVVAELKQRLRRVGRRRGRAGSFRRGVLARKGVLPLREGHGDGYGEA